MEPLSAAQRRNILQNRPGAEPGDIEEYERLLAARFLSDPDRPRSPGEDREAAENERRLQQLFERLFV